MYLKKLQLQGFKTFANKTEFLYDSGITAIVGPNGSGKSNIADAVRWVLGEQRYSLIRGKKTEDVIFAGSSGRPGMGFAEASITFDNTDRKLPLDYGEVTITRRAYRTGENEYYINRNRVRLKDIQEAISTISSNYSVITQGLVDVALSQKPEERRNLFEDAAAIGHYNTRKNEAEERLNKTQDNMQRVSDLLSEITPRLKSLEKNAKAAEEYYNLQEELQKMLKRWYGHRWRNLSRAAVVATQHEQKAATILDESRLNLEAVKEQNSAARSRQAERRAELARLHRESSTLHTRAQQLQQQVAVDQEKLNGLHRQRETQEQELVNLRVSAEGSLKRFTELEAEHNAVLQEQQQVVSGVAEQEAALKAKEAQTRQIEDNWVKRRDEAQRHANRIEALQNQVGQLVERKADLARQEKQYYQTRDAALERQAELEEKIAQAQSDLRGYEGEVSKLTTRRKTVETELASTIEAIRQHERKIQEYRSKLDATKSRLELLTRLQNSFAGLHNGVKSVMQASKGKLKGVLGLASNLLEVPAGLEVAIETAMGGHLQDIVVESWKDAEAAVNFLREGGLGRATFLPLDSLQRSSGKGLDQRTLSTAGVKGMAVELVEFDSKYFDVYEQLLGRVVVVDELKVARAILSSLPTGFMAVTLGGEIVRSSGAVTGGANGKDKERTEGGVLMRERELRELPRDIANLEQLIVKESAALSEKQKQQASQKQQTAELEREQQGLNRSQQQAQEKLNGLKSQVQRLLDELKVREETQQNLSKESANLDEREKGLKAEQAETHKAREQAQAEAAKLEKEAKLARNAQQDEREKLAALRTTTALSEQRLKNSKDNLDYARQENTRLKEQVANREQQLQQLEAQGVTLRTGLGQVQAELNDLGGKLEKLRVEISPLEKELDNLERELSETERHRSEMSSALLELEAAHSRAALELERLNNELENLQIQASADLAPSLIGEQGQDVQVDPSEWVELLEMDDEEARQLQLRLEQGRGRLRRIGAVNPLAMQEYRETSERHAFMSKQLQDLEQATLALRELIRELNQIMQQKFSATFELVAEKFKKYFGMLFNGGSARLYLTDPDNLAGTGIEIVAQPPGKKLQNLSLLSGGERALTAAALLFALLEVNPTPFCVLDEVDAALDEANVNRFCETLKHLSDRTQFIVITHNRGTIEAARTIYGISMGPESVSKTISLRLDEVAKFRQVGTVPNSASVRAPAKPPALNPAAAQV